MSYSVTTDIHCDTCSEWLHGFTRTRSPELKAMKQKAVAAGWRVIDGKNPVHNCPDCVRAAETRMDGAAS